MAELQQRLKDEILRPSFDGIFPTDNPRNTRFSINYFTSIGMGVLTEDMRELLKNLPKPALPTLPAVVPADDSDSVSVSSYSSYSSYTTSRSYSSSPSRSRTRITNRSNRARGIHRARHNSRSRSDSESRSLPQKVGSGLSRSYSSSVSTSPVRQRARPDIPWRERGRGRGRGGSSSVESLDSQGACGAPRKGRSRGRLVSRSSSMSRSPPRHNRRVKPRHRDLETPPGPRRR